MTSRGRARIRTHTIARNLSRTTSVTAFLAKKYEQANKFAARTHLGTSFSTFFVTVERATPTICAPTSHEARTVSQTVQVAPLMQ